MKEATEAVASALRELYVAPTDKNDHEAIARAVIEALSLTEERCCDGAYADREFGKYSVYTCGDEGRACRIRLVSKWRKP